MKKRWMMGLLLAALLGSPVAAHAYVDPGAGSMLLQLLLGGVAGLLVVLRLFKQRIFKFFGLAKDEDEQE